VRSKTSRSCAVIDFLLGFTSGLAIVKRQEVQIIHEDSPEARTFVHIEKKDWFIVCCLKIYELQFLDVIYAGKFAIVCSLDI
jgi:hypothetical protein